MARVGSGGPRFLVLCEDGSGDSVRTMEALAKKLFFQLEPAVDPTRLAFDPPEREHRDILTAMKWRSQNAADLRKKVALRRTIANQLVYGFVIFHFDGDRPYAQRAESPNLKMFAIEIVEPIRHILRDNKKPGFTEAEIDVLLQKMLIFQPFYSIEAWAFYNTRKLRELCAPGELDKVNEWHADVRLIEELEKPKEHLVCRDRHNRTLVEESFPTKRALGAGKSLADTLTMLAGCQALVEALRACARQ